MVRMLTVFAMAIVVTAGSVGCCSSCGSCGGHGRAGYWRNWGLPGKHPVGKACCRKCDLCEDVGGPCGGWARTGMGSPDGEFNGVETEVIYDDMAPPTSSRVMPRRAGVKVTQPATQARVTRRGTAQY